MADRVAAGGGTAGNGILAHAAVTDPAQNRAVFGENGTAQRAAGQIFLNQRSLPRLLGKGVEAFGKRRTVGILRYGRLRSGQAIRRSVGLTSSAAARGEKIGERLSGPAYKEEGWEHRTRRQVPPHVPCR
jgi:hypothetical protein